VNRARQLARLREEAFDVVVIGGGVTGAAAARDAARRGLGTALVEARDFGQGTSSRSSRLIHGGLRYLENLELDLVFEASRERRTLLEIAPHLVRPLEFLFPLYEEGRVGKARLDAGMWLYDALSLFRNIERHQMLDADEVRGREPGLRADGLLGGARYFDAQVDDARLVLATVKGAARAGAAVANRVEATGVETDDGAVIGVRVRDLAPGGDEAWTIPARVVLNATGPWAEETLDRAGGTWGRRMRPTRGSHVQVERERLGHDRALIFESPLDRRIMFVLPWGDLTMIGTTDEDHDGDPADVVPTAEDVAYLLGSTNRLFPEAALEPDDVVGAWAGVRPLVTGPGDGGGDPEAEGHGRGDDGPAEEEVSRDFAVVHDPPGMLTIAGGKLTSHRHMAEELVDRAAGFLEEAFDLETDRGCDTDEAPLPGGDFGAPDDLRDALEEEAAAHRLPGPSLDRLARAHGTGARAVLSLMDERPGLREPVADGRPYLRAEVVHAARSEMALHVEDVLFRRTRVGWEVRELEPVCRRVADLMADEHGWGGGRPGREVHRALEVRRRDEAWREELEETRRG
jgi:glycerol-3-phosphate dehydrogenase